jgi:hypothetical protein
MTSDPELASPRIEFMSGPAQVEIEVSPSIPARDIVQEVSQGPAQLVTHTAQLELVTRRTTSFAG